MYGRREVSIANIRANVSSYDIFKYYCTPMKKVGVMFCSELRADNTPSCKVFAGENGLWYKDFTTGDSYDDISYLRAKFDLSFYEALSFINRDFDLGFQGEEVSNQPSMAFFGVPDKTVDVNAYVKPSAVIKVKLRDWNGISDKEYWKDKYEFSVDHLTTYEVYPLKFFWINSRMYSCKDNTYGYYFGVKEGVQKWKIYQPLEDKEKKWFSNVDKSFIQGIKLLPETGKVLYITSSLKDVMALAKLGLYAIAPSAESTILDSNTIEELHNRFEKLIILYDNDEPGIKASAKHKELYRADEMRVPISSGTKDPSDFAEKHGYNELLKLFYIW